MKNKKVIIRVEGDSEIGLGHIYRGIALAEIFKDKFRIEFVTKKNTIISPIKEAGFNYTYIPQSVNIVDEPKWLNKCYPIETVIILDGYAFNEKYQQAIKKQGFKLIYVDDLVKYHMYADVVINHSPGVMVKDYKAESYTHFALGPSYAILRPSFLKAAKQDRLINIIDTAFVCFGGADELNFTLKTVEVLLQIQQITKINIVLGEAYQDKEIYELQKKHTKINIFKNLPETDLVNVMYNSNFAIAPASTILFELCAVKISIATCYYVNNQLNVYNGFVDQNAVHPLGDIRELSPKKLKRALLKIMKNEDISTQLTNQQSLIDDKISERFLSLIKAYGID